MSDKLVSIKAVMTIANDMVFACHNEREEFEKRLNELIAVPQPMSAEEYAKAKWQMCKSAFISKIVLWACGETQMIREAARNGRQSIPKKLLPSS